MFKVWFCVVGNSTLFQKGVASLYIVLRSLRSCVKKGMILGPVLPTARRLAGEKLSRPHSQAVGKISGILARKMWIRQLFTRSSIVPKIDMGKGLEYSQGVFHWVYCLHSEQDCFEGTHFLSMWLEIHFLMAIFFPNWHSLHVFTADHHCLQVLKKSWNMWVPDYIGFWWRLILFECFFNASDV